MKRIILWTLLVAFFPMVSHGAGYIFANYGNGGEANEQSYGLEIGGIFLSPYHPTGGAFSIGIGASVAETDEDPPSYSSGSLKYNDGNEQEIYAAFGAEIVPSFFGVIGLGCSVQSVKSYGSSGNTYVSKTDNETNFAGMIGMRYVIKGMAMGLGYDYRRGVIAGLGVAF